MASVTNCPVSEISTLRVIMIFAVCPTGMVFVVKVNVSAVTLTMLGSVIFSQLVAAALQSKDAPGGLA